jgi:hypothetical protein
MRHRDYLIRSVIDYALRRRPPGFWLISSGVGLFGLLLGGLALDVSIPLRGEVLKVAFSTESVGGLTGWGALVVALGLVGLGVHSLRRDWRDFDRRRVVAIELRGLRDWKGRPLVQALPSNIPGRREEVAIELRQGVEDGVIGSPKAALERLMALRPRLEQFEAWRDREDVAFVVGGLAPVPFSFLAGVLLDDEAALTLMDWDRDTRCWRELDGADDGGRFVIEGLDSVPDDALDVLVAVSVSYAVDLPAAQDRIGAVPTVALTLPDLNTANHWSEEKQIALRRQFLDVMTRLKGRRIGRIHLVLAAQNSVVLGLGAAYDKRNLPPLTVYQYDSGVFTWGVDMPVAGVSNPALR